MPNLLTYGNAKIVKGEKVGYLTVGLHLAPAELSGRNVCAHSTVECRQACLHTAGRGGFDARIPAARIRKTQEFSADRRAFMVKLAVEIEQAERRAIRKGLKLAVRLNLTSDIPWENVKCGGHANIMAMFPGVVFYDYTKFPAGLRRKVSAIPNYSLTFSRSGRNDDACADALEAGVNVAAVFSTRKGSDLPAAWAINGSIYPVIDGDVTDLRFTDPTPCIVGLRAKGLAKKAETDNPFIINV